MMVEFKVYGPCWWNHVVFDLMVVEFKVYGPWNLYNINLTLKFIHVLDVIIFNLNEIKYE